MAPRTNAPVTRRRPARALVTLGLSALVVACGTAGPGVRVVGPDLEPAAASDRFGNDGLELRRTAAGPRAWVDEDALEADAPERYTVVRGDTLWDISDRFLKEPFRWPEIWGYNPQIANPHLIYPGDEIALEYVNGRPSIVLTRNGKPVPGAGVDPNGGPTLGAASGGVTRLSPRIRSESLDDAVPTIPGDAIAQFLVHPRVVDLATIREAPYVFANREGSLASAVGQQIYARGDISRERTRYGVYRPSKALVDPVSGRTLGQELTHVADAKLMNVGDPSTLVITNSEMETIAGDILLPSGGRGAAPHYVPRLPRIDGEGRIVSLVDAISQAGRDQVVVLNIGEDAGLAIGDMLAIESRGASVVDRRGVGGHERVKLPNNRTGVVMVFETFESVSYALVMESTRPVEMNDIVTGI